MFNKKKEKIKSLEGDKLALQKTIISMGTELSSIKSKIKLLQNQNEKLNWVIKNGKGY